jgi:hypothetical protein
MKRIVIIGADGHHKVIKEIIQDSKGMDCEVVN